MSVNTKTTAPLHYCHLKTPIGNLLLAGTGDALCFLSFATGNMAFKPEENWIPAGKPFKETRRQLLAYFAGELKDFNLPLNPSGTPFQQKVWRTLSAIPFGETRSYGWLATKVGNPKASRAVGAANGKNPIPIILPCHRIIGADGSMTGFGGGLPIKKFLLELEGVTLNITNPSLRAVVKPRGNPAH